MTSRRALSRRVQEFPMTAEKLLAEAAAVVRDRRHTYGQPLDLFERVAVRWSQVLGTEVTPAQVMVCLVDLKVARLAHDPGHRDSLIDLIGYSVVLHELMHDASAAKRSAEVAELAELKESPWGAAAEALLKSAEVRRSAG
jgi:hypothetical protein